MNRRNLLKTFLAAPAVIRSGVLMPVVPLVVPAGLLTGTEVLRRQGLLDGLDVRIAVPPPPDLEAQAREQFTRYMQKKYHDQFMRAIRGAA